MSILNVPDSREEIVEPKLILTDKRHQLHDLEHGGVVIATREATRCDEAEGPLARLVERARGEQVEVVRQVTSGFPSLLVSPTAGLLNLDLTAPFGREVLVAP